MKVVVGTTCATCRASVCSCSVLYSRYKVFYILWIQERYSITGFDLIQKLTDHKTYPDGSRTLTWFLKPTYFKAKREDWLHLLVQISWAQGR